MATEKRRQAKSTRAVSASGTSGKAKQAKPARKPKDAEKATSRRRAAANSARQRLRPSAATVREAAAAFVDAASVLSTLAASASKEAAAVSLRFFKTAPGEYGAGDQFLGIRVPVLRTLAKRVAAGGVPVAQQLLKSAWHEARLLALFALVQLYQRGDDATRAKIFKLYLANTRYINNWDMVDSSAPHIVGAHLSAHPDQRGAVLDKLAASASLWERRIAMLATQHFIRQGDITETLRLAKLLLRDREDLMHKATGWMLREAMQTTDKARAELVMRFLRQHQRDMPRTMLRYAIERLSATQRKLFLAGIA